MKIAVESHLLQSAVVKSSLFMQVPFHFDGIGPKPSSLKLSDSGHIPKSPCSRHNMINIAAFHTVIVS
ncbi:hypothetical protein HanIR_Chr14g0674191 [Helianthus annuus]|nr:hypothetical protein HanIR_Chr14g0674191 [Helianthus annuus]